VNALRLDTRIARHGQGFAPLGGDFGGGLIRTVLAPGLDYRRTGPGQASRRGPSYCGAGPGYNGRPTCKKIFFSIKPSPAVIPLEAGIWRRN
jgi:hypothetical protein